MRLIARMLTWVVRKMKYQLVKLKEKSEKHFHLKFKVSDKLANKVCIDLGKTAPKMKFKK